jgi:DNA-directed RNA polymerase III subunit RPC1
MISSDAHIKDVELLGMDPSVARPEDYLWQYISVPPTCIRPTVQQEDATNEDDLSVKLSEIVYTCNLIQASLMTGQGIALIMVSPG